MEKVTTVLEIIVPIFAAVFLGMWARKNKKISEEENRGFQQFVINFGLPCILFNSCLNGKIGMESVTTMLLVFPMILFSSLWAFKARKKKYPYYNLPLLFSAQESGMLGIPLYMTLFGIENAYRVGVLDITQSLICVPVIAILAADTGENPKPIYLLKKVFRSPLLLMSMTGLLLNLTGGGDWLNQIGVGSVITETTSFIAQPVSAVILFSVGYNFSMSRENRKPILEICGIHFVMYAVFCVILLGVMSLIPGTEMETKWAILLYCTLPTSYLGPGFGKSKEERAVASSVCSLLTVVSLIVFCIAAAAVA